MPRARTGAASADDEAERLEGAIRALETQRPALGDDVADAAIAPLARRLAELRAGGEQRRIVSVLFADLVDFTPLTERLDPEQVRTVVDRFFGLWRRAAAAHGGEVEKYVGDAVMIVFGLRRSWEDDGERAVRTALGALAALEAENDAIAREFGVRLAARAGIDSGEVVVSTLGDRDGGFVAVGPPVNRAARLQAAAPPGRVLVSDAAARLIGAAFVLEEQQALTLKGVEGVVTAAVVRGPRADDAEPARAVRRTVGQGRAAEALRQHLEDVVEDRSHRIVTVIAVAGAGKSRLLADFAAWAEGPGGARVLRGRATPTTRTSAGAVLRDLVSSLAALRIDDEAETVARRLEEVCTAALGPGEGALAARLIAAWLRFLPPGPGVPTDARALRDHGSAALARVVASGDPDTGTVVLLEDLHWADDESLRWLDTGGLAGAGILAVASARPEFRAERPVWGTGSAHRALDLPPLTRAEGRSLLAQLLPDDASASSAVVERLLDSGGGNPFYLQELAAWAVEHRASAQEAVPVPPTLRRVLQARLDVLPPAERAALSSAAVIGRVFWDVALARVGGAGAAAALAGAPLRELAPRRPDSRFAGATEYAFAHALVRDVAYEGLLRRDRERRHHAVADWLRETVARAGREDEYAAVIAEHLDRGGDAGAATWYLRAARQAAAVFANAEAAVLLDAADRRVADADDATRFDVALERQALLDRTGDRPAQEAELRRLDALDLAIDDARRAQRLLARAGAAFQASAYDEAAAAAQAATEAAERARRDDLVVEAALVLGKIRTWQDEGDVARDLLHRVVADGGTAGRPALAGEAHRYLAMIAGNTGDFTTALHHGDLALTILRATGDPELEAAALTQQATTFYKAGLFAEAQEALEAAIPVFRRAGHRYREAVASANLAAVALQRLDLPTAVRGAGEAIDRQRELGDPAATAISLITLGAARALSGDLAGAEAPLGEAVAIAERAGDPTLLADALLRSSHRALLALDAPGAVQLARRAVAAVARAPSPLDRATAELALGHAALADGDAAVATDAFATAQQEAGALDLPELLRAALIGAAAATAARGDAVGAAALLEPALEGDLTAELGRTLLPGVSLLAAVRVLEGAGDPRAGALRSQAQTFLRAAAATIGAPEPAAGFLALPPHAALLRA